MATVYGDNYTKFLAASPASFLGPCWNGPVKCIFDKYTFASAQAGEVVKVGTLYAGEVYLMGWIIAADLSSAGTLILGDTGVTDGTDTGDADRYLTATVFTTTGQMTACARYGTNLGLGYKTTVDRTFIITTATEEMTGVFHVLILKGGF